MPSLEARVDAAFIETLRGANSAWVDLFMAKVAILHSCGVELTREDLLLSVMRLRSKNLVEIDCSDCVRAVSLLERIALESR